MSIRIGLGLHIGLSGVGLPLVGTVAFSAPGAAFTVYPTVLQTISLTFSDTCTGVDLTYDGGSIGSATLDTSTTGHLDWTPTHAQASQDKILLATAHYSDRPDATAQLTGTVYTPAQESGIVAYIDMTDAAAYSQSGGTMVSVKNKISGVDWSTGAAAKPAYTASGINGKPSMTGNGTTTGLGSNEAAVLAVTNGDDTSYTIIQVHAPTTQNRTEVAYAAASSGSASNHVVSVGKAASAGGVPFLRKRATSDAFAFLTGAASAEKKIIDWAMSGTSYSYRKNNGTPETGTIDGGTIASDRFALMYQPSSTAGGWFLGDLSAHLMFSTAIDSSTRARVNAWAAAVWGLTLS